MTGVPEIFGEQRGKTDQPACLKSFVREEFIRRELVAAVLFDMEKA
jgi:hypothetical protein